MEPTRDFDLTTTAGIVNRLSIAASSITLVDWDLLRDQPLHDVQVATAASAVDWEQRTLIFGVQRCTVRMQESHYLEEAGHTGDMHRGADIILIDVELRAFGMKPFNNLQVAAFARSVDRLLHLKPVWVRVQEHSESMKLPSSVQVAGPTGLDHRSMRLRAAARGAVRWYCRNPPSPLPWPRAWLRAAVNVSVRFERFRGSHM